MVVNLSLDQTSTDDNSKKTAEDSEAGEISMMDKINNYLLRFTRIPLKEKLFFVQHLGLMLKSGISLSTALKTLAQQTKNKNFISVLNDVASRVEKGSSFAESLGVHKKIFGELFVSMVEAGEISGKLENVLAQLFIQMKKENTLISKVKGALTYPAIILLAMLGIGAFMMVMIIPKMTAMFTEMNAELPLPTKILIGVSNAIAKNGLISAVMFVAFVIALFYALKTQKGKYIFQAILLNAPIISPIVKKINLARFARNISSLLKTDIMIIKAFQITANVLGNLHYRTALMEMSQKIKKGGKLSETVAAYPKLFTPVVTTMIAVGEETGELDNILMELASFYEEEVDLIMDNLPSIIEPLLILFLGTGVGGVAVAIIMPMYSITESI
ncbi:hypothetical protein A2303_05935 [Candidatus Falkowbacteria bacterium RIFOXYB2_FULL_47_14]|uniref:Type II secretion system protein GspF domain-containing protein n=1 Tax=Candidatus Falkowbacteria bacterium RIFOXYA2_FULL_47_19 TaxID=1797994 RepID=A0A1F5SNU4_9BACT|nr:MAG: hypothetical protein A2227_04725 [Candidatus Falkowbacteria bacterium RIFOXYA2_FULL_47_19]OGF35992.1 MAG: hypothetical protein A2468_00430 [Candidatus Falkowbacteria bacterium RIFOXYC2_FULL_46_15]OGF42758.1 MAG: hypothetical protein A2303_05935 [Candidatus Falkowbacteria bacterium RIFOXYB2_FULL_47_14]